ncbi:MAG: hypothetical protein E7440_05565 [Ruminococcaceae bacterium]|nr:hypothetical protein [Oscillospiraceae bacterium]
MKNLRIEDMSTEQKIGMLICARSFSTDDDLEFTIELIRNHALGCVQVPFMKPEIMERVKEAADYPILIVTDMEMGFPTSELPPVPLMTLAACDNPEYYRSFARAVVADAKKAGYNGTWNPDVDLGAHQRRISDDPEKVAEGAAYISEVYSNNSFLNCGKHFPGGAHRFDTHMANDGSHHTKEELLNERIVPYFRLMEQGLLDSIMVGHSVYTQIDPDNPATLSKKVIDLIRDRGFDGVVWTDSLAMMAILQKYGEENVLGMAVAAGCDIVLPNYRTSARKNYEMLLQNYRDGAFTEERLNEAVRRVLAAQEKVGTEPPHAESFTEKDRENYYNIASDCITAITDPGVEAALPADNKDRLFIIITNELPGGLKELGQETVVRDWYRPREIEQKIHEEFPEAETVFLPEFPTAKDNERALVAATKHKEVVFVTYCNSRPYQGWGGMTRRAEAVINALIFSGKVSAVLHFGNPEAMQEIDHVSRRVFGYMMPESQLRAIEVLAGKLPAKGKMPYHIEFR